MFGLNSTFLDVPQSEFTLKGSILGFNVVQPDTRFHFKSANQITKKVKFSISKNFKISIISKNSKFS
jgi:hypothetical protein